MAFITTSKKTIVHVFLLTTSLLWSACRSDANRCKDPANGMIPIYDLGVSPYRGYTGGLYPLGSNRIPASHFAAGMHQGSQLQPLNGDGEPAADGLVGCMSLGYSTAAMTTQYVRFIHQIKQEWPELLIANAAQAGKDLNAMTAADHAYWQQSISMILEQGLTPEQVQIIWLSTSDATVYDLPFPEQPRVQLDKYQTCLKLIREYFPNVRIVFVSDRAYGGYISEKSAFPLREPAAWYTSWSVKWLIEAQINQEPGFGMDDLPFIDWGPTLWTDGSTGDSFGYTWSYYDAGKGGIHPSAKGRAKEATRLYLYLRNHPYLSQHFGEVTSRDTTAN